MKHLVKRLYRWVNLKLALRGNVRHAGDLRVGIGTTLRAPDSLVIGRGVSIAAYTTIACNGSIGDGVLISSNVGIVGRRDHDHRALGRRMAQSPWLYAPDARPRDAGDAVDIGPDVWIGFGAIILSGVRIGRGAVVAAGAVVVSDVEPYAVVAGNPARRISWRFTPEEQARHEALLEGR